MRVILPVSEDCVKGYSRTPFDLDNAALPSRDNAGTEGPKGRIVSLAQCSSWGWGHKCVVFTMESMVEFSIQAKLEPFPPM